MLRGCVYVAFCVVPVSLFACNGASSDKDTSRQPDRAVVEDGVVDGDVHTTLDICTPDCEGKNCGDDGCGHNCGGCIPGTLCVEGLCPSCTPECTGLQCGVDGCGGYCGNGDPATNGCTKSQSCTNGICQGGPGDCTGKECGSDGADGSCGICPCDDCSPTTIECSAEGICLEGPYLGCKGIFDCFDWCEADDDACRQDCVNSSNIEGQIRYNNLIVCLDDAGYFACETEDDYCLDESLDECLDHYYECFHGDMVCVDLFLCIVDCSNGEAGVYCVDHCLANGTTYALKKWAAFLDCLEGTVYFGCDEGDEACMDAASAVCSEEFMECAHGDMSCSEVSECLETCAPADQMCSTYCTLHGTLEAQADWDSVVDCLVEQCGEEIAADCSSAALVGACSDLYDACIGS
jgi:hypothetical protein